MVGSVNVKANYRARPTTAIAGRGVVRSAQPNPTRLRGGGRMIMMRASAGAAPVGA